MSEPQLLHAERSILNALRRGPEKVERILGPASIRQEQANHLLPDLVRRGYVRQYGDQYALTEKGREALQPPPV